MTVQQEFNFNFLQQACRVTEWTQVAQINLTQEAPLEGGEPAARGGGVPAPELAGRAADEDVVGRRVYHPVVALARVVVVPRNLEE